MAEQEDKTKIFKPHVLDRMILLLQREADTIAIFQDGQVRAGVRKTWDPRKQDEHKQLLDLAQLVHLVRMVEPEFKKLARAALGSSLGRRRPVAVSEGKDDGDEKPE